LAAALQQSLGISPQLIKGSKGIFDVKADGAMVYSKYATGRFPTNAEIVSALKGLAGAA